MVPHEAEKLSSFPHLWGDLEDITAIPQATQIHPQTSTSRARRTPNAGFAALGTSSSGVQKGAEQ